MTKQEEKILICSSLAFLFIMIIPIVLLCLTRFSFTYYFILYKKSKKIDNINRFLIIE